MFVLLCPFTKKKTGSIFLLSRYFPPWFDHVLWCIPSGVHCTAQLAQMTTTTTTRSVNKFEKKHIVNASSCAVALWMYLGDVLGGLLSTQELKIVYWSHERAQWEYEARSRYWIRLGEHSSYVIMSYERVFLSRTVRRIRFVRTCNCLLL